MRRNILKACRELIGLSQEELAAQSGVPLSTLKRIEAPGNTKRPSGVTVERLERFFRTQGVVFTDTPERAGVFFDTTGELAQFIALIDARDRHAGINHAEDSMDDDDAE